MAAGTSSARDAPKRVWASLITNLNYLPGILTLAYSIQKVGSEYPLVALYTDALPPLALAALEARGIPTRRVPHLSPASGKQYADDPRFNDTWTKLVAFSLVEFDRVVLLDSDMIVRKPFDELMTLELDAPENTSGNRVFAASHACACNPLKKRHYPKNWVPENCAYTSQHTSPDEAQITGSPTSFGIGMLNSGLLVINPSTDAFSLIVQAINTPEITDKHDFPDQGLLSEIFKGRWVPLPYVYNALKTLRWRGVHDAIWRDDEAKIVHYIFAKKPWSSRTLEEKDVKDEWETSDKLLHEWWWKVDDERRVVEKERGITDEL
ncbi:glycosyl transferase family protein [Talaromyces proteolyticus]|uniref:Glycosyl transferase family protein n=1 Tax=Talaromyces proteolyticus TaxID=1131652 RepID=A0AAD4L1N9_9EURO|nr:glycosyl transferase family protein [Talaromyces proteolyticus]KAH8703996.1 glycosyl transferase family protein [Talaromyces proteolyticus]